MADGAASRVMDAVVGLVDASLAALGSYVSVDVVNRPQRVDASERAPVLAIAHDGAGMSAADVGAPGESVQPLCNLIRGLCAELEVDACLLSCNGRGGDASRVAAFYGKVALAVHAWDASGERTTPRQQSGAEAPTAFEPFEDEAQVKAALAHIGEHGTLILISDRAGARRAVRALDLATDWADIRISLPSVGTRVDLCRAPWRTSLRERLCIAYGVALPVAISLRGSRVALRQKVDIGMAGAAAVSAQIKDLRTLHGVSPPVAAVRDTLGDEDDPLAADDEDDDDDEEEEDDDDGGGDVDGDDGDDEGDDHADCGESSVLPTARGAVLDSDDESAERVPAVAATFAPTAQHPQRAGVAPAPSGGEPPGCRLTPLSDCWGQVTVQRTTRLREFADPEIHNTICTRWLPITCAHGK